MSLSNELNSGLNKEQLRCVYHVDGPLLVLAGAGSGKTKVVTTRICHLLEMGVPPNEILAVTFTNKAAKEMMHRVQSMSSMNVFIATFHALCSAVLRESIHHLEFTTDFAIYDSQDSLAILKKCMNELGYEYDKQIIKSLASDISNAKNALKLPSDIISSSNDKADENAALLYSVYSSYQAKLKECNALDFDDLLLYTSLLFKSHPDVLSMYQKRWSFVLIDEYQDTNAVQYSLITMLTALSKNVFAVGDPDQSIYSWRGANIENILHFEDDFPGAEIVKLEQNYRSTQTILSAANAVIEKNTSRYEKKLWSSKESSEKIHVEIFNDDREEASYIIDTIAFGHSQRKSLDDYVLFYRTNSQSRIYEDALLRQNIPYQVIGGISFYDRREIKDVLCLLRVCLSLHDLAAFERIINTPKRGFGPKAIEKLQKGASETQQPFIQFLYTLRSNVQLCKLESKQYAALESFLQARDDTIETFNGPIHKTIETALSSFKYMEYLSVDKDTYEDRKSNVDELLSKAAEWTAVEGSTDLAQFLEEISLRSAHDTATGSFPSVKLMTLHNSKGLEFDTAFMVGLEEDLFPHINSKHSEQELEEERRLCYVGMTRAKNSLYMCASKYRLMYGTPKVMHPSRFLYEIPEEYIESSAPRKGDEGIVVGSRVQHKSFGSGTVLKSYESSLGLAFDVTFDDNGHTRTLIAKYAKLQKI